jgi:hypothetical protein
MVDEPARTLYSVTITGIGSEGSKEETTRALSRVVKNVSPEKIAKRLESLPWTLTRSATERTARRLDGLLTKAGAFVEIAPPLPGSAPIESKEARPAPVRTGLPPAPAAPRVADRESTVQTSAALEMEPLTLGGILDRTFNLCRSHFWKFVGILAIPLLASIGVMVLGLAVGAVLGLTWNSIGETSGWILVIAGVIVIPALVVALMIVFYLSQGAVIHAVAGAHLRKTVTVVDSYRFVYRMLGRYVLTSMLCVLVILLLTALPFVVGVGLYFLFELLTPSGWWSALLWPVLLIPPAYAIPKFMLFDKVVIIEDLAYTDALKRSWKLLTGTAAGPWPRGYYVRFIILLNLFMLIYMGVSLVFQMPGVVIQLLLPESLKILGQVISQVFSSAGGLVSGMFNSVCLVVFYFDIRTRKEGFDLKMLVGMHEQDDTPAG